MNEFGYVDYSLKSSLVFRNRPLCDLAVKEERKRESERSLEKGGIPRGREKKKTNLQNILYKITFKNNQV